MLISSGTLVSKCCQAVILMDGNEYECSKCLKHCEASGTIGDLHAPKAERARLERAIVEAAKKWVGFYNGRSLFFSDTALANVINELLEFESLQEKK